MVVVVAVVVMVVVGEVAVLVVVAVVVGVCVMHWYTLSECSQHTASMSNNCNFNSPGNVQLSYRIQDTIGALPEDGHEAGVVVVMVVVVHPAHGIRKAGFCLRVWLFLVS